MSAACALLGHSRCRGLPILPQDRAQELGVSVRLIVGGLDEYEPGKRLGQFRAIEAVRDDCLQKGLRAKPLPRDIGGAPGIRPAGIFAA